MPQRLRAFWGLSEFRMSGVQCKVSALGGRGWVVAIRVLDVLGLVVRLAFNPINRVRVLLTVWTFSARDCESCIRRVTLRTGINALGPFFNASKL